MDLEFLLNCIAGFFAFLDAEFRPLVILVSSGFGVYFASKKIGQKVTAQYSVGSTPFQPPHIKEVVLSNKKDKPVNVYSVYAVFNRDLGLKLEGCSPPIVLKPYESLALKMTSHSFLHVGSDKYEPEFSNAKIYIESDDKLIRCESSYRPSLVDKFRTVSVVRHSYNGFVYGDSVAFILCYVLNGSLRTAFIHKSGYIGNEWGLDPNYIGRNLDENSVKVMLRSFGATFDSCSLYRVESSGSLKPVPLQ